MSFLQIPKIFPGFSYQIKVPKMLVLQDLFEAHLTCIKKKLQIIMMWKLTATLEDLTCLRLSLLSLEDVPLLIDPTHLN